MKQGSTSNAMTDSRGGETQPGFKVGQRVLIRRDDPGRFAGLAGVIDDFQPNVLGVGVLNRYVVVFSWGREAHIL